MAAKVTPKPELTPVMKFMTKMAGIPASSTGNKASSQAVESVRTSVNQISEPPKDDYDGSKKVLNPTAAKHAVGITAAVVKLAQTLFDMFENDNESFQAIAATGFVSYFAKYYCDSLKLPYKRADNTDYANQCNSTVIGPNLAQMLNSTKKKG